MEDTVVDDTLPGLASASSMMDAGMEQLLTRVAEKTVAQAFTKFDERVEALLLRQQSVMEQRLQDLETKWSQRLAAMEERLGATEAASKSAAASLAASLAAASASHGSMGSRASSTAGGDWRPTKLEIKGFVRDWARLQEEGLSRNDVHDWLGLLRAALTQDASDRIDFEELIDWDATLARNRWPRQGSISVILRQAVLSYPETAMRGRALILGGLRREARLTAGRELRVVSETDPAKAPTFRAGGRALGLFREWAVPVTPRWSIPLELRWAGPGGDQQLLGTYTEEAGWVWQMPTLIEALAPRHTPEELMTRLTRR